MKMIKRTLRENLAKLEHEQWVQWSRNVWSELKHIYRDLDEAADFNSALRGLKHVHTRWSKNWCNYDVLSEKQKDKDRVWADKVIKQIRFMDKRKDQEIARLENELLQCGKVIALLSAKCAIKDINTEFTNFKDKINDLPSHRAGD